MLTNFNEKRATCKIENLYIDAKPLRIIFDKIDGYIRE